MADQTEKRGLFVKSAEPLAGDHSQPHHGTEPQPRPRNNEIDVRTMVVGAGMSLSGTLTSCNRLIVEGTIDATLDNCQNVIIAEPGVFRGDASTDNADVQGQFDGNLVVRKRLMIRATGQVSGTITYGEIEIECGGKISGEIKAHEGSAVAYARRAQ